MIIFRDVLIEAQNPNSAKCRLTGCVVTDMDECPDDGSGFCVPACPHFVDIDTEVVEK